MKNTLRGLEKYRPQPAIRRDLLAVGALIVLTAGFFWQVLLQGYHLPNGEGDMAVFIYPRYSFAASHISGGSPPLWLPHLYAGQPYLADIQSGLLYPLNLLAFFLVRPFTYAALEYSAILHYLIAGLSMYLLARRLGLRPLAALAGAITWEFCGFLVAHLGHYNMLAAAVWLPLVFWALHPAMERRSIRWALVAAGILAVSTLAGHTQMTLLMLTACVVYGLFEAASGRWRRAPQTAGIFAIFLVAAGLFTVVQLLPSWELTNQSVRSEIGYQQAVEFDLAPHRLITLVIPHFYGNDPGNYWGPPSLTENFGYVGLAGLALALVGLVTWRRKRIVRFAGVLAAAGILLSLGDWTPFHGWFYELVPGYDRVRAPGRFLFLVDFGLAILAAYGIQTISRPFVWRLRPAMTMILALTGLAAVGLAFIALPIAYVNLFTMRTLHPEVASQLGVTASSAALAGIFSLIILAIFLAYRLRLAAPGALAGALTILLAIDLFVAGAAFNPTPDDPTYRTQYPPALEFLRGQPGLFRIDSVTGIDDVWKPDSAALHGFDSIWGVFNPFTINDYYWYWKSHIPSRSSDLYDMLNVRYVLAPPDVELDQDKFVRVFDQDSSVHVFENQRAMPRAWLVGEEIVVDPRDGVLAAIRAEAFDPRRQVVLEKSTGLQLAGAASGQTVTISNHSPNRISLVSESDRPSVLVLSEVYYPGWRAMVDGQPSEILRANWTFRAVALEAGRHEIDLTFRPTSLLAGAAISGLAWLLATVYLVAGPLLAVWRARTEHSKTKAS